MIRKLLLFISILTGCRSHPHDKLKIAATSVPHAELLEFAKPELKKNGVDLKIILLDNYNIANRALAEKELDANFFQHLPFLEEQVKEFHYPLISLAKIDIEPMGVYSEKISSLSQLKKGDLIAIPNDPTNEARALYLLQKEKIITLTPSAGLPSILHISENLKNIHFRTVDAALLPRILPDVSAAVINANYALQAHLSPTQDAIALEGKDSPYVNVIVIRKDEEGRKDIQELKEVMTSEKMKKFIEEKYHGAVIPAF